MLFHVPDNPFQFHMLGVCLLRGYDRSAGYQQGVLQSDGQPTGAPASDYYYSPVRLIFEWDFQPKRAPYCPGCHQLVLSSSYRPRISMTRTTAASSTASLWCACSLWAYCPSLFTKHAALPLMGAFAWWCI